MMLEIITMSRREWLRIEGAPLIITIAALVLLSGAAATIVDLGAVVLIMGVLVCALVATSLVLAAGSAMTAVGFPEQSPRSRR